MELEVIARIHNDFPTKFGLPRQSGLIDGLESRIVFEPGYRDANALKGIEEYSHLWLIWHITGFDNGTWSPTVRPPKLGGNRRVGVFASRSPNRPNPMGLTCVKLLRVEKTEEYGHVLIVSGADIMDGTPIWDIKPYIPYADCIPEASGSFSDVHKGDFLSVECSDELISKIREDAREGLMGVLAHDPRPGYHRDPERVYGFEYAGREISFTVKDGILTVTDIK